MQSKENPLSLPLWSGVQLLRVPLALYILFCLLIYFMSVEIRRWPMPAVNFRFTPSSGLDLALTREVWGELRTRKEMMTNKVVFGGQRTCMALLLFCPA